MKHSLRIFQILVLLLPTQFGLHFWPLWSFVSGIRIDYLSPTIYLTDLVFFVLFAIWILEDRPKIGRHKRSLRFNQKLFLFILAFFAFINIVFAYQPLVAVYKWFKVLEFLALGFYVFSNKKVLWRLTRMPLSLAVIYTCLIAFLQFFLQRTIGGVLYLIGERSFTANTPGISLMSFFGRSLMRPYATFPHPNALGGFLVVSVFLLLVSQPKNLVNRVAIILGIGVLALTFSQNAWFAFLVMLPLLLLRRKNGWGSVKKVILFLIFTLSLLSPIISQILISGGSGLSFDLSIRRRLALSEIAGILFSKNPLFGVGLGGFIPTGAEILRSGNFLLTETIWWLQPVHNIYLLILTEVGAIGFLIFSFFIYRILVKTKSILDVGLILILLMGMLDHYWLTLQQNFLYFAVLVGFLTEKDLLKYKS